MLRRTLHRLFWSALRVNTGDPCPGCGLRVGVAGCFDTYVGEVPAVVCARMNPGTAVVKLVRPWGTNKL